MSDVRSVVTDVISGPVLQTVVFEMPLRKAKTDAVFNLVGEYRTVSAGETGDYSANIAVGNNHLFLKVNSITGSGVVMIVGASVDERTQITTADDTEFIQVDEIAGQHYQTTKKWWKVSPITVFNGITAINYDIGIVGYVDLNNENWELLSYRVDLLADGNKPDCTFELLKIQDDGDARMSLVDIENITVQEGDRIIDNLRSGAADRSNDLGDIWDTGNLVLKQGDLADYFRNQENFFNSRSADEGLVVRFEDVVGVDIAVLQLRYQLSSRS